MRMENFMKTLLITLTILITFSTPSVFAQACGGSFANFVVKNSKGKNVKGVTVELLTAPPREKYKELWEKFGHKEAGFQPNPFKVPADVANELLGLTSAVSRTEDFCGNPLKQTAGKTVVKTWKEHHGDLRGTKENFGFCKLETFSTHFLLKISARGYLTEYYLGSYLGGCGGTWYFTMTSK